MAKKTGPTADVARIHEPGAINSIELVPRERLNLRALLVGNPNYFGTLKDSPFAPKASVAGNTTYEEIKCVGFHPQAHKLQAVVFTKQPFGFLGGVCTAGSQEYVRFYLSFDNGASWVDQGLTQFSAYDVPGGTTGGKRIEHAVSIDCTPPAKWCTVPNVILARAILEWNKEPPANTPGHIPVWGNVHDTHIQVDPRWLIKWVELFELAKVKFNAPLAQSIDLEQTVEAAPAKALSVLELQELYLDKGVEPHRFALAEITKLIDTPELTAAVTHPFHLGPKGPFKFDVSDVVETLLQQADGSTVYEELDCVGLRSSGLSDELVAVLRLKRPYGFSGGPCTAGSREYVTFWADFDNNGTFETCLGTASVGVYDLDVPPEGLEYSVSLPVDLNPYRRPCQEGPRVVPIRAILSWNQIPACGNPNWVPTWGNREETLILIPPGTPVQPGQYNPFLYDISGRAVCSIDQGSGMAAVGHPFGGVLCITGEIPAALALAAPDLLEYRVWATQGSSTLPIVSPFNVTVEEGTGPGTAVSYSVHQTAPTGWFTYREHGSPALGAWRRVSSPNRLLARWNTSGLTGLWTIHVEARMAGTTAPVFSAGLTTCLADGTTRSSVKVALDQEPPVAAVDLTGYSDATGFHAALPCGDISQGVAVHGTFDITDNVGVGSYGLVLEPLPVGTVSTDYLTFTQSGASTPTHVSGDWTLQTAPAGKPPLPTCGYVIHLTAWDGTIVGCGTHWRDDATVGFCLRSPQEG
ncbi:MAG: hypothetical protein R3E10_14780 [Gemmatimonadota bacterium]